MKTAWPRQDQKTGGGKKASLKYKKKKGQEFFILQIIAVKRPCKTGNEKGSIEADTAQRAKGRTGNAADTPILQGREGRGQKRGGWEATDSREEDNGILKGKPVRKNWRGKRPALRRTWTRGSSKREERKNRSFSFIGCDEGMGK